MDMTLWSFTGLFALGAFHGANPAMGWLFAVALGMQERRRTAVWRAMMPLALGHALAIAAAVGLALAIGAVVPFIALRWTVGVALLALGISRLIRHRHPRWVGMRVSLRDLTVWSFLMASAHGAGLMVLPLVIGGASHAHHDHMAHVANAGAWPAVLATAAHSLGYLAVSAVLAFVVFEKLGVELLRKAWLNVDLVWAVALAASSVAVLTMR